MDKGQEKQDLTDLAHRLKAPVDVILSYGRLIASESDNPVIREYAGKIEAAASGMSGSYA